MRAAYIAGFRSTSNLEAGRAWGIPTMGTAAHGSGLGVHSFIKVSQVIDFARSVPMTGY